MTDETYETRLAESDDDEVMWRIWQVASLADRIDPAIPTERIPVLVGEAKRRGLLTDPKYTKDEEFAGWYRRISDAARHSQHPAATAIRDDVKAPALSLRSVCPLCARPRVSRDETLCRDCRGWLTTAFGEFETVDDIVGLCPPMVRAHAPICYLCGVELTDHMEHVIPRAKGGEDRLSNVGGACWHCNLSKGDRILDPTPEQRNRLTEQQAAMRATLDAIDRYAFWTDYLHRNWGDYINDAVDDWSDWDPDDVDRSDVENYITDASEDDLAELPFMPRGLPDRAVDEVLRRIKNSVR